MPTDVLEAGIILAIFAGLYFLLVFMAMTWWQGLPLAIMLALSMAAIGFNIEHDGGHQAYSNHAWVNRVMAMTMDLIGASSYVWRWKHVVVHHTYTNLTGHDADIDLGFLGRLTPHQKRFRFHRWQHFYLWPQMRGYDSHTPILFFSGAGCNADKKMGHEAGANAYVIKPDISHLLGTITQFIPRAKSARG